MRVIVLLSTRQGRARRHMSPCDQAALALAHHLGTVTGLHMGSPSDPALEDYLGFGLHEIRCIGGDADGDVLDPLLVELRLAAPDLILAGAAGEERGGMLPYRIATSMCLPLVADALTITVHSEKLLVERTLGPGKIERVLAPLPAIVTVASSPTPIGWSLSKQRSGHIITVRPSAYQSAVYAPPRASAKKRMRWIGQPQGSAAERIERIRGTVRSSGAMLSGLEPAAAADAILSYLLTHGLFEEHNHD